MSPAEHQNVRRPVRRLFAFGTQVKGRPPFLYLSPEAAESCRAEMARGRAKCEDLDFHASCLERMGDAS